MKPERSYLFFSVLLIIHLLFFLSSQIRTPGSLSDSDEYLNASHNLYQNGVLYCGDLAEPIREEQFTRRPPLYPLLLGFNVLLNSEIPVMIIQIILSLCSILLVLKIFDYQDKREPGTPEKIRYISSFRVIALIFIILTPAQFIYASRIMSEIPFQFLLILAAWSVSMYFRKKDDRFIWLFNLVITLGMATKPVLFPFAILTSIISVILFLRVRRVALLWALIIPLAWITGYSFWNHQRVGTTQYSSIQTANMVNYNLRYFIMNEKGADAASAKVDELYAVCGSETSFKDKNDCLDRETRKIILKTPLRYTIFHLKGSVRYFLDPGRFDLVTFFGLQEPGKGGLLNEINQHGMNGAIRFLKNQGWGLILLLGLIALFKLLKLTGFLFYVLRRSEDLPLRLFLVILVGYMSLVTGPLGASRFLLPVELLVIAAAVEGWMGMLKIKHSVKFIKIR